MRAVCQADATMKLSTRRNRRTRAALVGTRESQAIAAALGAEVAATRRARHLTLEQLSMQIGLHRTRLAEIEHGEGGSAPLATWVSLGIALNRALAVGFSRDIAEPRDAGHLAAQELLLRLARATGRDANLELAVGREWRPYSIDVVIRDQLRRVLIVNEIWNRMDDVGASLRNHDRKMDATQSLAVIAGGNGPPFRTAACWVLRATAANRALAARYPEILRTRFSGSSRAWVNCLVRGDESPTKPGVVWADVAASRLFEVRLPPSRQTAEPPSTES